MIGEPLSPHLNLAFLEVHDNVLYEDKDALTMKRPLDFGRWVYAKTCLHFAMGAADIEPTDEIEAYQDHERGTVTVVIKIAGYQVAFTVNEFWVSAPDAREALIKNYLEAAELKIRSITNGKATV